MNVIDAIAERSSPVTLTDPGPDPGQLRKLLEACVRAPDHGRLSPWRFVVIEGESRKILGNAMRESLLRRVPDAREQQLESEAAKALRAPTIIAVAARPSEGKIPREEQVMAVAAGVQNMLLAAQEMGLAAIWKTGAASRDDEVKEAIGLNKKDLIVSFLYVGAPERVKAPRKVEIDDLWWTL